jgi:heavy metal sensor kinase
MKSIRLSLTVYFLVLLIAALGTASLLVYRTTKSSLQAREQATERLLVAKKNTAAQLLQTRHDEDVKAKHAQLDADLLAQARTLAGLVQFQFDWGRFRGREYNFVGALGAVTVPHGGLLVPLWVAESDPDLRNKRPGHGHGPGRFGRDISVSDDIYGRVLSSMKAEIKLTNNDLSELIDPKVAEFFQVNSAWGTAYYSQKMDGKSFGFDPGVFKKVGIWQAVKDDTLGADLRVRVALYKAPAARQVPFGGLARFPSRRPPGERQRGAGRGGQDRGPRPEDKGPRFDRWIQPGIFIQCACSTSSRDAALAALAAKLNEGLGELDGRLADDLDRVRSETAKSLASLRWHLLAVSLCTFAAAVIGTLVLVRLGLAPLHRLGEAVSRVSEKDFRLQYGKDLPHELSPIALRLNHTLEQLKRAFAREKQATADISHELRTPLSALLTTIDVTLRKPRAAEEYKEALEDCRASGQQINQAVERLLALARLDAGVDALRRQPVDATALAQQCVAVVRPLAEARGLAVSVKGDSAPLNTDPDKLREVLNNLLHNAIEYNKPNGRIDVAVARQNGHLCLEVQDTGIGIPMTARAHIFERFFRADPSRQADGLHAGLGLAIVKGYVDLMGGTIDVDSTEGQGSTFSVRLPA